MNLSGGLLLLGNSPARPLDHQGLPHRPLAALAALRPHDHRIPPPPLHVVLVQVVEELRVDVVARLVVDDAAKSDSSVLVGHYGAPRPLGGADPLPLDPLPQHRGEVQAPKIVVGNAMLLALLVDLLRITTVNVDLALSALRVVAKELEPAPGRWAVLARLAVRRPLQRVNVEDPQVIVVLELLAGVVKSAE